MAVAILDLVVERGFGAEAEPLEDPDRSGLIGDHLGREFLDAGILREIENRLRQQIPEAATAKGGVGDDADFADVARPSVALAFEHGPLLDEVNDRALCRAVSTKTFGWSLLVEAEIDEVQVAGGGKGLAWYHGAFHTLES